MDADNPTADQPVQQRPHRRWSPYLLVLAAIPIFYFVNKLLLACYYGDEILMYTDYGPRINPILILIETGSLVFLLKFSKRRWYQYSLRTLVIAVTLFAFACSWFAVKMQQAKRQKDAVDKIRALGGYVDYCDLAHKHYMWAGRRLLGIDFVSGVRQIEFESYQVTDDDLECLKDLTGIVQISLCTASITDVGLRHITVLKQLRSLDLSYTHISDDGLKYLKELPQLETLILSETAVTDKGIKDLSVALPNLKIHR